MRIGNYLKNKYLILILLCQPILDIVAFFFQNENATVSGYIRLGFMVFLFLYTLFFNYKNKKFLLAIFIIALPFVMHILNSYRVGYISFLGDLSYLAKVIYMPIIAICFCTLVDDDNRKDSIIQGMLLAFCILMVSILISYFTNSYTPTYDGDLGISGWVTSDNRCAQSNIIASLSIFGFLYIYNTKNNIVKFFFPIVIFAFLYFNATRSCYLTLIVSTFLFPCFALFYPIVNKEKTSKANKFLSVFLIVLCALSIIMYPTSPRSNVSKRINVYLVKVEEDFAQDMLCKGYDVYSLSKEDILNNEEIHSAYVDYYTRRVYGANLPMMIETYGADRIMEKFDYTVSALTLEDSRIMNLAYASFIFEDSDLITKFFGFEFDKLGIDKSADVENDWFAILYYYGYFAFAIYLTAVVYLLIREIKLLIISKNDFMSFINFAAGICFTFQLGLGYFSGAIMRRPNSSIYLACVIALIYYQTRKAYLSNET